MEDQAAQSHNLVPQDLNLSLLFHSTIVIESSLIGAL